MAVELIVTVKDDEKRLTKNHLIYEPITASEDDPIVAQCIKDTKIEFGNPTSDKTITVKIILSVE